MGGCNPTEGIRLFFAVPQKLAIACLVFELSTSKI